MSLSISYRESAQAEAAGDLLLGAPVAVAVATTLAAALGLPALYTLEVLALYAGVSLVILFRVPAFAWGDRFAGLGPANRVTLGRLLLILPLAALALQSGVYAEAARWWVVGLGTVAVLLDGVDGWMARRTASGSDFGARFDMESDAGLILILSILVWRTGQAPAWAILMGAMRYLFVAAGWSLPALRGSLFPSLRRKVVCVVQIVALLVAAAPILEPVLATGVVGVALLLLGWSFAVDTAWLLRQGRRTVPGSSGGPDS